MNILTPFSGSTQMFSGTASIDEIGSTTVISVQVNIIKLINFLKYLRLYIIVA